jgi:SNF2 family DNA or RNA helicase
MEIREHQQVAVDRAYGQPGFGLFDGMGKGKTATTLFEVRRYYERGPVRSLVVCPKAAIDVWKKHSELLLPDTTEIMPRNWWTTLPQDAIVIVNYEGLTGSLGDVWWDYVIADECHYISNRNAQRSKALKAIRRVKFKRALSGTPFLNTPDRLWSTLNWLYPQDWRGYWPYYNHYVDFSLHTPKGCAACGNPHHRNTWREIHGPKNVAELRARIHPFCIRRTSPETNIDHEVIELEMYPEQRRAYKEMEQDMLSWITSEYGDDDEPLPAPVSIAQQMRLRQFASAYMMRVQDKYRMAEPSNKLDAMMMDVEGTDMPLVIFSNFTQLLNLASKRLSKAKIPHSMYTGENPGTRDLGKEVFQRGLYGTRVMLANIKAGGIAITLSTGRHALFLDESYSPEENHQAWGRLFNREDNPHGGVVKHFRSANTIETRHIPQRLAAKLRWFKEVFD